MKKVCSLLIVIALVAVMLPFVFSTNVLAQEITVSSGDSLSEALTQVADGGIIRVDGTVAVTAALGTHGKTVTITGGELDFTGLTGDINLGDHITFDNMNLKFADNAAVFANGYKVKVSENVTMTNPIRIFAAKRNATVASTDLTILGGKSYPIFGGGNNGAVTGDVKLYVGGNANAGINAFDHGHTYCIFGGGYIHEGKTADIGGTANVVFAGNAQANYLYGANYGPGSGTIQGGADVTVSGGNVMSVYGGNRSGNYTGDSLPMPKHI